MSANRSYLPLGSMLSTVVLIVSCGGDSPETTAEAKNLAELGEVLFHDANLSLQRTQACSTCHDPAHGFIDPRRGMDGLVRAVSLGDDGVSLGDRNAPTVAYAAFSPRFEANGTRRRFNKQGGHKVYQGALGGQFHDGREPDLEGQAGGPPLNPIEMGMPDRGLVVGRLRENPSYVIDFEALFGAGVLDDPEAGYSAMTQAIAEFERTPEVSPFDSRYDRALRGELQLTFNELTGRSLFFSEFTNCAICHQLHENGDPIRKFEETFSGYEYHNIGVPANIEVRAVTGVTIDRGLLDNPAIDDPAELGKFKVPTLRNVAVTGPYMHNGVFRELRTVIEFYEKFVNPDERNLNPETGLPWRDAEIPETISQDLLEVGRPLTDVEITGLECFLRTLTDSRYEHLLPADGLCE